jgi:hypothetical protein
MATPAREDTARADRPCPHGTVGTANEFRKKP